MFLQCDSTKLNNYSIHPNWCLISDNTPLSITIPIAKININLQKRTIVKNSDKEDLFIKEVITSFAKLDMSNILENHQL